MVLHKYTYVKTYIDDKKCMNSGMMYLCKTTTATKKDPYVYTGSGKHWLHHIKKHKSYIITCIIGMYDTKEELKHYGEYYSLKWSVVNSDN